MITKLWDLVKMLLILWVMNLLLMSTAMLVIIFVGAPIVILLTTGKIELLPSWDEIYKSTEFVLQAAFWTGLILWLKLEVFKNYD